LAKKANWNEKIISGPMYMVVDDEKRQREKTGKRWNSFDDAGRWLENETKTHINRKNEEGSPDSIGRQQAKGINKKLGEINKDIVG
jgi:hypothetical protein